MKIYERSHPEQATWLTQRDHIAVNLSVVPLKRSEVPSVQCGANEVQ